MSNELPIAVVTVRFDKQSITGGQVAALVQQVVGQDSYVEQRRFYDGDVINFGKTSGYPYEHIRVVPSLDGMPYFRPEEPYSEVKVTSHSWGGSVYAIGYGQDSVTNAVKELAAELSDAYQAALSDTFPSYSQPQNNRGDW